MQLKLYQLIIQVLTLSLVKLYSGVNGYSDLS